MTFALASAALALLVWAAAAAAAAVSDVRTMTIPNRISIALVALFPVLFLASGGGWTGLGLHAAVGAATFAACLVLFARGWFGGGDAKLLPAMALWAGPSGVLVLVLATALAGGVVALMARAARRLAPAGAAEAWGVRSLDPEEGVPYAVAIAAGAVLAAPRVDWLQVPALLALLTKP